MEGFKNLKRPENGLNGDVEVKKLSERLIEETNFLEIQRNMTPYHQRYMELTTREIIQEIQVKSAEFQKYTGRTYPHYVFIEGTCGSGKTTMYKLLTENGVMSTDDHVEYAPREWEDKKFGVFNEKNYCAQQATKLRKDAGNILSSLQQTNSDVQKMFQTQTEKKIKEAEILEEKVATMGAEIVYKLDCLTTLHSLDMALEKAAFYSKIAEEKSIKDEKRRCFILGNVGVLYHTRRIFTPIAYEMCQAAEGKPNRASYLAQRYNKDFIQTGIIPNPLGFFEISTDGATTARIQKRMFPDLRAQDTEKIEETREIVERVPLYNSLHQRTHKKINEDIRTKYSQSPTNILNSTSQSPEKLVLTLLKAVTILATTGKSNTGDSGTTAFIQDVANGKYKIPSQPPIPASYGDYTIIDHLKEHSNDYGFDFASFMDNVLALNTKEFKASKQLEQLKQEYKNVLKGGLDVVIPYHNTSEKVPFEDVLECFYKSWKYALKWLTEDASSERKLIEILKQFPLTIRVVNNDSDKKFNPEIGIQKFIEKNPIFKNKDIPWTFATVLNVKNTPENPSSIDTVRRVAIKNTSRLHTLLLDSDVLMAQQSLARMFTINAQTRIINGASGIISTLVSKIPPSEISAKSTHPSLPKQVIKANDWIEEIQNPEEFAYSPNHLLINVTRIRILEETNYLRKFQTSKDFAETGKFYGEWTLGQLARPGICLFATEELREATDKTIPMGGYGFENGQINNYVLTHSPQTKVFIDPTINLHVNDINSNPLTSGRKKETKNTALKTNAQWYHEALNKKMNE